MCKFSANVKVQCLSIRYQTARLVRAQEIYDSLGMYSSSVECCASTPTMTAAAAVSCFIKCVAINQVRVQPRPSPAAVSIVLCSAPSVPQPVFTTMEKAPTRAFSWLKTPTNALTFKTLLGHNKRCYPTISRNEIGNLMQRSYGTGRLVSIDYYLLYCV